MAKKYKRLNPYHPKVNLYSYEIRPKNKGVRSVVRSGWSFGLSVEKLKSTFYPTFNPKYYTYRVKKIDKTRLQHNYKFNPATDNRTDLYL